MEQFTHTCFQVLAYEPLWRWCEKNSISLVPGELQRRRRLLVTTGSEALENAGEDRPGRLRGLPGVIAFTSG